MVLELRQTNTAVIHRYPHQLEFKLHSPVFELSAPLDLDRTNQRDVGGILRMHVRSCRTWSFCLSDHFRNRKQVLYNTLYGESGVREIISRLPDMYPRR